MNVILKNFRNTIKQSTVWRAVVILELAVVLILLLRCFGGRCEFIYDTGNLEVLGDLVQDMTDEDGTPAYYVSAEESVAETAVLSDDGQIKLSPGAYRITIKYQSQVNTTDESNINNSNGNLYLESENNSVYLDYETLSLRNGMSSNSTTFRVKAPGAIDDVTLKVTFTGAGELTVYSVEISEIVAYRVLKLLTTLLLFGFLDLSAFLLFTDKTFSHKKELGVLILICLAGMLPFLADYVIWGHDLGIYLYQILLLSQEFPGWLLCFPSILYHCGVSISTAYNIYVCTVTIATCLIMYFCAGKIFRKSNSALFAAALYTLGSVRLTNILTSSDVCVYTAQTFLPLIVLGFYNIYTAEKGEKITIGKYLPAVIGLSCAVCAYIPILFMGLLLIAAICLILYHRTFERQRLLALCKASGLTVLISGLTCIVVLFGFGATMNIRVTHVESGIQETGAYLVQMLNPVVNNYQADSVNASASNEMSLALGGPLVVGLVLYLVYLAVRKRDKGGRTDSEINGLAGLNFGLCIFTLYLSSIYMFYDYLDFLPDVIYSILTSNAYSFRWLIFAALFGVFCITAIVDSEELHKAFPNVPYTAFLCALLILNTGQIYADQLYTSEMTRASNNYVDYGIEMEEEITISQKTDSVKKRLSV